MTADLSKPYVTMKCPTITYDSADNTFVLTVKGELGRHDISSGYIAHILDCVMMYFVGGHIDPGQFQSNEVREEIIAFNDGDRK